MNRRPWMALAALSVWAGLAGCHVDSSKNGDHKNVNISTPFGGLQVKTNDSAVLESIGLPAYPGATPVHEKSDDGAADVNMNFGSFHLRVKAASYRTSDSPQTVADYYRDAMKHNGEVLECRGGKPIGSPAQTSEGLGCENSEGHHVIIMDKGGIAQIQLKTGSKLHQHIVALDAEGGGTKIGLIALDLPGKSGDSEGEGQ